MASRIQIRRDTEANWTSANPTLAQGEMGIETDTLKIKIGDGTTVWTSLAYYTTAGGVSLLLDQDPAQTFTNGTVTGTGLLKVTSGEVGLDTTNYFDIATDDTDDITEGANKFVTATDITNLGNLSGTNTGDNTVCTSGAATTAVTLLTPRAIAGVSFDGTANISLNNNAITNGAGYITSYVDTTYTAGDDLLLTGTVFSNTAPNIVQTTVTGNAGSATALETPRAINGVDFDGSAPITVTADANTLSGTELASSVVTSSLTSVGTITTGVWNAGAVTSSGGISGTTGTFSEINVNGPLTAIESTMPIIKAPSTGKTVAIESIKVREGESGAFVDLVTGNKGWHGMTAIGNDLYACVYNGSIWKSTYTADVNVAGDVSVGGDLITTTKTPASASATGTAGTIAYDADYIYVCRATDTWKRIAIATW